jgi:hypothetical protein
LFNETMQGRIAVYLALVAAVILAVWLASPRRSRLLGWACALVALMAVLPNLASPSVQSIGAWTNPAFFRTGMYRHYIRRGQSVLPILWGPTGESFMWQAEDHMYWNMANGYWIFEPMAGWSSQVTADLWIDARPHSDDGPLLKQLISERHVSDVILQDAATGPYNPSKWRLVLSSAGLHPTAKVGGVTLYHVPASWWTSRTSR